MKLSTRLALSTAAIALLAAPGAQASTYYLSLFGGISTFDDDLALRQNNSTTSSVASHFISKTLRGSGPRTFTFKTGYSKYFTGSPGSTKYVTTLSTNRTIGFYKTYGHVFGSTSNQQNSAFRWRDDFSNGFVVGGAFGVNMGDGWRGELELAYRSNDVDSGGRFRRVNTGSLHYFKTVASATKYNYQYAYTIATVLYTKTTVYNWPVSKSSKTTTVLVGSTYSMGPYALSGTVTPASGTATGRFSSHGEVSAWSIMANLWYDYELGGNVHAIMGGGVGGARLDLSYNAAMPTYFSGTARYHVDDQAWGFAYQAGVGLGYDLGDGIMLSAQYRYFATTDVDLGRTNLSIKSHNFLVGLTVPLGD